MSNVEKTKKRKPKKSKKTKKAAVEAQAPEESSDVLERVMDSIEMAGASLDFFEDSPEEVETKEASEESSESLISEEAQSLDEALEAADNNLEEESLEASEVADEVLEATSGENNSENIEEPTFEDDEQTLSLVDDESSTEEFVDQTQAYSIIESLLFSSDKPLGLGTFKQVFKGTNYKTKDIKKALEEMESVYADASRGVSLEEVNGGWQLRTKVDNMDFLRKLAKARPFRLSGPALEVLSIIAYKQPMVKSEVDQIRGVESGHLVRALMEKHLVCFQGKSELPGKPMQYGTTKKFLEIFGLRNLKELPSLDEIDQLLPDGIGMEEEDEKLSDVTAGMSEDYEGNYSEGEEELLKISDTLGAIDTSSEFFEQEKQRQKEKRDRDRAQDIREAMDVGEEVESKDQKWLARYDAKMEELAAQEQEVSEEAIMPVDGETVMEEPSEEVVMETASLDETLNEEVSIGEELSMLSSEGLVVEEPSMENESVEASEVIDENSTEGEESSSNELEDDSEKLDPFSEGFE